MSDHPTPAPRAPEAERPTGSSVQMRTPDGRLIVTLRPEMVKSAIECGYQPIAEDPEMSDTQDRIIGRQYKEIVRLIFRAKAAESRSRAAEEELERVRAAAINLLEGMRKQIGGGFSPMVSALAAFLQKEIEGAAHPTQGEDRT